MNCPKYGKGNLTGRPKCEFYGVELPVSMASPIVRSLKFFIPFLRLTAILAGKPA